MEGYFSLDAWIVGGRQQHHRTRDHFGVESDLYVVLSEDIGPYPMYTPIHFVIEDFFARLLSLEDDTRRLGAFFIDAVISDKRFTADAVVKASRTGSFTVDATFAIPRSFTVDAWIETSFTIDAFII